jgi:hypothetical protein
MDAAGVFEGLPRMLVSGEAVLLSVLLRNTMSVGSTIV